MTPVSSQATPLGNGLRLRISAIGWIVVLLGSSAVHAPAADPPPIAPIDFARDVLPIWRRACFECHGPNKQEGGLRLDQREAALRGGDSGPPIVPGDPDQSELLLRVALPPYDDGVMPARGQTLSPAQISILRRWIQAGASWPSQITTHPHWAYAAPQLPALPAVNDREWPRTPVDYFILAPLDRQGLRPSPVADAPILIRRLYLDLIGLPPSPEELRDFLEDDAPNAYERLVDRLLTSPQFGAKWARPWLDYSRYADSHGFQRDDFRDLWPYRDWVVAALNADMPFDEFTVRQLAGDLLPNAAEADMVASGFNRSAPTNVEAGSDPEETRVNQLFDRVNTLGMVWLGTTLECCQCHDHKYDPFTMRDYYGLLAFFNSTEIEADRSNPKVPGSIRFLGPEMPLRDLATDQQRQRSQQEKTKLEVELGKPSPPTTLVMRELAEPRISRMFTRGDFRNPGQPVVPATPAVLPPLTPDDQSGFSPPVADGARPGVDRPASEPLRRTRLDLARWLVRPDNPLVARVVVNRWWAELFGQGLVTTPEDFGLKGEPPTHPELLDWLAVRYQQRGWSLKQLLRKLVLSATYRQSSRITPELLAQDDRNQYYARGARFRLPAESIRDNALAIAGLLSLNQGGPPIRPYQPDGVWIKVGGQRYDYTVSPGELPYRRGLYIVWKRGAPYPSMMNFDANNRLACRVQRPRSNTPLQALSLLNDPVYVEAARAFALRVLSETPADSVVERLRHAFQLAVARTPQPRELEALQGLFDAQRAASQQAPDATKQLVGQLLLPVGVSHDEFAAWYAVTSALLNLDETMTKG